MAGVLVVDSGDHAPTEHAMQVLKQNHYQGLDYQIVTEGDNLRKLGPLFVIGAVIAVDAVRRTAFGGKGHVLSPIFSMARTLWNGGHALGELVTGDTEGAGEQWEQAKDALKGLPGDFKDLTEFENVARFEDPLTGGLVVGESGVLSNWMGTSDASVIEDPSWKQRLAAGSIGVLQGFIPTGAAAGAGAGLRAGGARLTASGATAAAGQAGRFTDDVVENVVRYGDEAAGKTTPWRSGQESARVPTGRQTPLGPETRLVPGRPGAPATPGTVRSGYHQIPAVPGTKGAQEVGRFGSFAPSYQRSLAAQSKAQGPGSVARGQYSRQRRALDDLAEGRASGYVDPYTSISDPTLARNLAQLGPAERQIAERLLPTRQAGKFRQSAGDTLTRWGTKGGKKVKVKPKKGKGWKRPLAALGGLGGLAYGVGHLLQSIYPEIPQIDGGGGGMTGGPAGGVSGQAGGRGGLGGHGYGGQYQGHGQGVGAGLGGGGRFESGHFDPFANVATQTTVGNPELEIWRGTEWSTAYPMKGEKVKIGERMLKQAEEEMHKAVCPSCGKANCNCKEYKNKGDKMNEKESKKPAHGLVIVIGSKKAGPGPSTEGKRDKLDSEKNDD